MPKYQGPSTLEDFISGVKLSDPSIGSTPKPWQYQYSAAEFRKMYPDAAAEVGEALGGVTLGHLEVFIRASAAGRGKERYFGNQEKLIEMAASNLEDAAVQAGFGREVFESLGIADGKGGIDRAKLGLEFSNWLTNKQVRENEEAFWRFWGEEKDAGKLTEGFGVYSDRGPTGYVTKTGEVAKSLIEQETGRQVEKIIENLDDETDPRWRDIPFVVRGRTFRQVDTYLKDKTETRIQELESKKSSSSLSYAEQQELNHLQFFKDNRDLFKDSLSGYFHQRGSTLKNWDKANKIYGTIRSPLKSAFKEYDEFNKDTEGYIMNLPVRGAKYAGRKLIWEKYLKDPLNSRWRAWIKKHGLEKIAKELSIYFRGGLSKLGHNTAFRFGELVGRYLGPAFKQAISSISQVIKKFIGKIVSTVLSNGLKYVGSALASLGGSIAVATSEIWIPIVIVLVVIVAVVILAAGAYFVLNPPTPVSACTADTGAIQLQSPVMQKFFVDTANKNCVPVGVLLAIANRETGGNSFTYSDQEFQTFSTPDWWVTASADQQKRGYCYNNFAGAAGIMQFIQPTFNGYVDQVRTQTSHQSPNRCNAQDSIVAAALKIKADSGTSKADCTNWSDSTITNVAGTYCGNHCDDSIPANVVACGTNYCGYVLDRSKSVPNSSGCAPSSGGNSSILQALAQKDPANYCATCCGSFVNDVLQAAGYSRISEYFAVEFFTYASKYGYTPITKLSSPPQPGDVVVWYGNNQSDFDPVRGIVVPGASGHVDIISAVSGNSVLLTGNIGANRPYKIQGNEIVGGLSSIYTFVGLVRAPAR